MKFGKYLETKQKPEWKDHYVDYSGLKDLIKAQADQGSSGQAAYSPRTTSLTVQRYNNKSNTNEEAFFKKLEADVEKVARHTSTVVEKLRQDLSKMVAKSANAEKENQATKDALLKEAHRIGDDFLQLEKFVNINYMAFHKILKKHDKMLPHAPCRQFYVAHLHQQPWVQGNYSDLLVQLSNVYSKLRGDTSGVQNDDSAQGFCRSTTKYWVRNEDVSTVKHHILQHLPVFQHDAKNFSGDAQLVNSVYLDNASAELYHGRLDKKPGALALRIRWYGNTHPIVFVERKTHKESWKGEESVKERFVLAEDKVVPFLDGDYTLEMAIKDNAAAAAKKGKTMSEHEIADFTRLFTEIYKAIDSKQLRPFVRTQYMRTAFQIPFDSTVRTSLDTNLCMIKENPEDGPTCAATGRWYRDPDLPIHRTEITRFPHAVLEVKLSLKEGQVSPPWVQEMIDSGYLVELHKFSKFIHGTATLFPEMVRAVPYWVDDESVRASMIASAPESGSHDHVTAIEPAAPTPRRVNKPTISVNNDDINHPLLGDNPTLKLMPNPEDIKGFGGPAAARSRRQEPSALMKFLGIAPGRQMATATPMRIEPKTFFANERTFLAWLHMAVTLGSISAALLGFASGSEETDTAMARHLVELIALILLPVGMFMVAYALYVFTWRAGNIAKKKALHVDDRVGPTWLCFLVVVALSAIFLISCVDFYEVMEYQPAAPAPPPPALTLAESLLSS